MSDYNFKRVSHNGESYVFVTRGRSKPFSEDEVESFFNSNKPVQKSGFEIPSTKVFAQDLRAGLDFCSRKYGVSREAIEAKAAEVFPHLDVKQLLGK